MRLILFAIPLAVAAVPAAAATPPPPGQIQIPRELTDPKLVERIQAMSQALSSALLNLPVGQIQAAAEGRPATEADRRRTVRDLAGVTDQQLQRTIAVNGPKVQAAVQALQKSLPAMSKALSDAQTDIERAVANMPRPDYPKR
jgi:hypothetical protein